MECEKGENINYNKLIESYMTTGFQATNLAKAIEEINKMLHWRLIDEPINMEEDEELLDLEIRKSIKCTIWLGFTSNMFSSGIREIIKFLCKNKLIDIIVSSAGGIEEDLIKCMGDTYLGEFSLPGKQLRMEGLNRIGNLLVPNLN